MTERPGTGRRMPAGHLPPRGAEDTLDTADAARVHEPRASLIELTLQNEKIRHTRQELEAARDRYADLYEHAPVGYLCLFPHGLIRDANRTACRLLGYTRQFLLDRAFEQLVPARDRIAWTELRKRLERTGVAANLGLAVRSNTGTRITATSALPVYAHDGRLIEIRIALQDTSSPPWDQMQGQLAAAVIDTASEGVVVADRNQCIIFANPAFGRLTGIAAQYALGRNALEYLAPNAETRDFLAELWKTLARADRWLGDIWLRRGDGTSFPASLSLTVIRNESGRATHFAGTLVDISARKQFEEQIRYQANYDPITGLPNRTLFIERLSQALKQANRKQCQAALLFLDMDHFKQINDILGHDSGDRLLREAAQRLLSCVRENDSVIRVGGDEFAIVLPEVPRPQMAARVARKVIAALARPFEVEGNEVSTGASVGIALYPMDADDSDMIRQHADMAMYRAKQAGRGNYQFFAGSMTEVVQRATRLEQDLRHAVRRQELMLYYQPILELGSGALVGAEALLRWHHPSRGILLPAPFLATAEDSSLMREIGEWTLYEAFQEACTWPIQADRPPPYVSVNLSNRQLTVRDGIGTLSRILESSGLAPQRIVLEITERVMMTEISHAVDQLRSLKELGLRLALDDFGTGYSSLTYLKRFPIDLIKIDQSFIADVDVDPEVARLVEGILSLSHGLGLQVIAEAVEVSAQEVFLKRHGCDYVQGFYYGRPMPAEAFRSLLITDDSSRCRL